MFLHKSKNTALLLLVLVAFANLRYLRQPAQTKSTTAILDTLATGLTAPWDFCFLPSGDMLFTERAGRVRLYRRHRLEPTPVLGLADVAASGKMGLLGICLHPDFSTNGFVYLAYNYVSNKAPKLKVVRYTYRNEQLKDAGVIIENLPAALNHTGCRLLFGPDKKLYITVGDADVPVLAQDLKVCHGKILRLNADGSVPADNPFTAIDSARKEIWSYGHRNPQGLAFDPTTGQLYETEHGPTGGDEINLIVKGANYGWPAVHHREAKEGVISPLLEFSPSIGPAAALFSSGKAFPELKGHLLVGCMRGEAILNLSFQQSKPVAYQYLLKNSYGRIRALAEGPDGFIYFATSQIDPPESRMMAGEKGYDMVVRLRPASAADAGAARPISFTPMEQSAINHATAPATAAPRSAAALYAQLCASCHGRNLKGANNVPSLTDNTWLHGGGRAAIVQSIANGIVARGMPAWKGVLSEKETAQMADFILAANKKR